MLIKHEVAMYIVARMILGFGIVFCIVSGSAILGELVSCYSYKQYFKTLLSRLGVKVTDTLTSRLLMTVVPQRETNHDFYVQRIMVCRLSDRFWDRNKDC